MSSQDLTVLDGHDHSPFESRSCFNCRFDCGSLVSRTEKGHGDTFGEVLQRRLSRRGLLKSGLVLTTALALGPERHDGPGPSAAGRARSVRRPRRQQQQGPRLTLHGDQAGHLRRPAGRRGIHGAGAPQLGRPALPGRRRVRHRHLTAAQQERRFGFNSDFVAVHAAAATAPQHDRGPALGQPRVHRRPDDVPGLRPEEPDQGAGRHRAGRPRRQHRPRPAQRRRRLGVRLDARPTTAASPRTTPMTHHRAGRRRRLAEDDRRPDRHHGRSACSTTAAAAGRRGAPS